MIDLESANLGELELKEIELCLKSGVVSTRGSFTQQFEGEIANYLGVDHQKVLATNSGTAALYLALRRCHLLPEDNVIVPALTFIATANAIIQVGCFPLFVDVDRDTWCIDFGKAIKAIDIKGADALIGVNVYGNVCDWGDCPSIIWLVEDSCESLGVSSKWKPDFSCYSFNGNKVITTGSGGLLIGNKDDIAKSRILASQGVDNGEFISPGFNYRMPALNAALGLAQLKRLSEFLTKKKRINEIYRHELSGVCKFQEPGEERLHSYWFTAGTFQMPAEILVKRLSDKGIPTRRVFKPIPSEKFYSKFCNGETFPNAQEIYNYGLCLPSGTLNADIDILTVCKAIKTLL